MGSQDELVHFVAPETKKMPKTKTNQQQKDKKPNPQ